MKKEMKTYLRPACRAVNLYAETPLLGSSIGVDSTKQGSDSDILRSHRRSIWDSAGTMPGLGDEE